MKWLSLMAVALCLVATHGEAKTKSGTLKVTATVVSQPKPQVVYTATEPRVIQKVINY